MPTLKGFVLFHKAVYRLHFYIFIRLFIWTDLQIIRNPFIRPWTWFKGNTGKHSYVWCLFGSHVSGSPVPLCSRLLLLNRSIFFSVFLPHTPHTPNRHKTVRAQGHRFVLINICSVLNCCPLILNSPCFQPTALFRLGRKGDRKKFPIISRTLISSTCAKMNHVIQHILSQPQGQKEKRKGKDMLFWPHRSTRKSLPGLPHNEKAYWFKHEENIPRAGPGGATIQDTECSIHGENIREMFSLTIQSLGHVLLGK